VSSHHAVSIEFESKGPIEGLTFVGGTGAAQCGMSSVPASFVLAPPSPERCSAMAWEGRGGRRWMPCVDLPNARYLFRFRVTPSDHVSTHPSLKFGSALNGAAH